MYNPSNKGKLTYLSVTPARWSRAQSSAQIGIKNRAAVKTTQRKFSISEGSDPMSQANKWMITSAKETIYAPASETRLLILRFLAP